MKMWLNSQLLRKFYLQDYSRFTGLLFTTSVLLTSVWVYRISKQLMIRKICAKRMDYVSIGSNWLLTT